MYEPNAFLLRFYRRDEIGFFNPDQKDKDDNGVVLNANYRPIFMDINRFINHLYTLYLADLAREGTLIKLIPLGFLGRAA